MFGVTPLAGAPRVEILGIYPTLEGLAAQAAILVILLAGFAWNRRESRRLVPA
jgi:high-affinity iron transporter